MGGQSPGLEHRKGGPATASGLGPSPIPVLRPQKPLHLPGGDSHRGKSLKLLEKIPEDAEATVVLVGKEGPALGQGMGTSTVGCLSGALACGLPLSSLPSTPLPPLSSSSPPVLPPALSAPVLCLLSWTPASLICEN